MCTKPKRNSLTSVGENRWLSVIFRKRACTGVSNGKFSDAELMLLAKVLPRDSWRSPPPKGRRDSESEKKKRAENLSRPPRNSRSQLEVNWSSLYWPGRLTAKGTGLAGSQRFAPAGAVVGAGNRYPPVLPPNGELLKFKSANATGSMLGRLQAASRAASEERSAAGI